jgi:hypothetical protein
MSERDHHPEVEIIPPGAPDPIKWRDQRAGDGARQYRRVWAWSNDPRYARLRHGSGGPLALVLILGSLAALGAIGFLVLLGALVFALPVIGAVLLASILGGILRRL